MNRAKRNIKLLRKGWALYGKNIGIRLDDEGVFVDGGTTEHQEFYGFCSYKEVRRFINNGMTFTEWEKHKGVL